MAHIPRTTLLKHYPPGESMATNGAAHSACVFSVWFLSGVYSVIGCLARLAKEMCSVASPRYEESRSQQLRLTYHEELMRLSAFDMVTTTALRGNVINQTCQESTLCTMNPPTQATGLGPTCFHQSRSTCCQDMPSADQAE